MLFKPKEVKEALQALDLLLKNDSVFADATLVREVKDQINDKNRTKASIREHGYSAQALIMLLYSNASYNLLTSGTLHSYRGILSGRGHTVLHIFDKSVETLAKLGCETEESAESDKSSIRIEIAKVG